MSYLAWFATNNKWGVGFGTAVSKFFFFSSGPFTSKLWLLIVQHVPIVNQVFCTEVFIFFYWNNLWHRQLVNDLISTSLCIFLDKYYKIVYFINTHLFIGNFQENVFITFQHLFSFQRKKLNNKNMHEKSSIIFRKINGTQIFNCYCKFFPYYRPLD